MLARQHPIFSPIALITTLMLLGGLGLALLFFGGQAFSPGDLSAHAPAQTPLKGFASHAEFEADCNLCHVPAQGIAAERCEACHTTIATQRTTGQGLHGRMAEVEKCARCHTDHRGRDFDLIASALANFDHTLTAFSLAKHERDFSNLLLDCTGCHTPGQFEFESARCADCHSAAEDDFMRDHQAAFGAQCLACHDGVDRMGDFHHADTAFPLEGAHAAVPCAACHQAERPPAETPTDCVACHAEPTRHVGMFGTDCAACHTPTGWAPAKLNGSLFDHAQTGFSLSSHQVTYAGQPFTCTECHTNSADFTFATDTCVACHGANDAAFMTDHIATWGNTCLDCHDGTGQWQNFDHAKFFALEGQHTTLACEACHVERQFKGTPSTCVGCHTEPVIHEGLFGTDCAACHTPAGWSPAAMTKHLFPLDHGDEGTLACTTCHTTKYTEYTCYNCHEHEAEDIQKEHDEVSFATTPLAACAVCHPLGQEVDD